MSVRAVNIPEDAGVSERGSCHCGSAGGTTGCSLRTNHGLLHMRIHHSKLVLFVMISDEQNAAKPSQLLPSKIRIIRAVIELVCVLC